MEKGKNEYTTPENKLAAPCPNLSASEPKLANDDGPYLSESEVREQLRTINLKPGSRLQRSARYHAYRAGILPDDLLQDAILAAMTSRKCPARLGIEAFIIGIMRSKASKIIERRERETKLGLGLRSLDQSDFDIAAPDPEEIREQEQRGMICAKLLAAISEGDPVVEKAIDGLGHGYRGEKLAEFAGVNQDELATVRRRIKRRAVVWRDQLAALDRAA
jgi:DNA-directed RNA polymerase specialized sigma24 family protein